MNTYEYKEYLDRAFHIELQEEWDNSGLLLGFDKEIKKVLVTLDITDSVAEEAISIGADMIISHHPIIFSPLKKLDEKSGSDSILLKLIWNRISVYSSHTNFDMMSGGNNDFIGKLLELEDISILSDADPYCRKGRLSQPLNLNSFIDYLAEKLSLNKGSIRYISNNPNKTIKTLGWCSGDGTDFMTNAFNSGVDAFLTGDVKYHQARYAEELGLTLIDIGHYGSELCFIENMSSQLSRLTDSIEIIKSTAIKDPFTLGTFTLGTEVKVKF